MPWYDFLTADRRDITADGGRTRGADDTLARLRSLIPRRWFSRDFAGNLNGVLGGLGDALVWIQQRLAYLRLQTRIRTATGFNLDIAAWDFFGSRFMRRRGEADGSFAPRIIAEVLRPRGTRAAVRQALIDLTGREPILKEYWNTADMGAYGGPNLAYAGGLAVAPRVAGYDISIGGYGRGRIGYGVRSQAAGLSKGAGGYGSLSFPNQVFITAYRPQRSTVKDRAGYRTPRGGYGQGRIAYVSLDEIDSPISDADILACVRDTVVEGVRAWVRIQDGPSA